MTRVAAYCRVSTAQDDQLHSLAQQREYFIRYIAGQAGWTFAGIYADEGLSGTSPHRPAFQAMLREAEAGRIDLILTKEVSRFARNTVDALAHTRALSRCGVGVIFLTDGIDTRQPDGEFRLTILAGVAQEESRKTSQRVKWGQKRSMERGVVFGSDSIYGFSLRGGRLTVKPDQAEIVRRIYFKFLEEGKGSHVIGRELFEEGVETPAGGRRPWSSAMVLRILRNEKYCGDLLQKKTYTPDFLDHKKAVNRGAEPQVLLRDHHEAIIPRAQFERAARELARRAAAAGQGKRHSSRRWCSGRMVCGLCGAPLAAKRRSLACGEHWDWVCTGRSRPAGCRLPALPEEAVYACMQELLRSLALDIDRLCAQVAALLDGLPGAGQEAKRLQTRLAALSDRQDRLADAYLAGLIDRSRFERLRSRYADERQQLSGRLDSLQNAPQPSPEALRTACAQAVHSPEVCGELIGQARVRPGRLYITGPAGACGVRFEVSGRRPALRIDCRCDREDAALS